jgi:dihydroflavonol-4-reductase
MLHVSSVDALGVAAHRQEANEESPRQGKIPCSYVVTKGEAESELQSMIDRGLDAVIVNPGFMIGPWDWKPSSGRMLLEVGKRFVPLAPAGGASICDVRDVAVGILTALERGQSSRNYILAGYNLSYLEIWRRFARTGRGWPPIARMGPAMRFLTGRTGDVIGRISGREPDVNSATLAMSNLHQYYSSARAHAELNYRNRPLEETLHDAWEWFKRHGYI